MPGISAKESSSPPAVSSLLEGEGELTMAGGALVGGEGEAFTWVPALLSATLPASLLARLGGESVLCFLAFTSVVLSCIVAAASRSSSFLFLLGVRAVLFTLLVAKKSVALISFSLGLAGSAFGSFFLGFTSVGLAAFLAGSSSDSESEITFFFFFSGLVSFFLGFCTSESESESDMAIFFFFSSTLAAGLVPPLGAKKLRMSMWRLS